MTALGVIKAAQRLGFTLEEVAELLEAGRHRHGCPVAGLQERAAAKLAEVDAKIADLATIRTALVAAVEAGCDDLTVCAFSACSPIPFTEFAEENCHAGLCCCPPPRRRSGAWPPSRVWRHDFSGPQILTIAPTVHTEHRPRQSPRRSSRRGSHCQRTSPESPARSHRTCS